MSVTTDSSRLAAILQSVTEAIVAADCDGAVTLLNPAAERLFGQAAAQAAGRPLQALHAGLAPWLDRARAESAARPLVFSLEIGGDRFYSATLSPILGAGPAPDGWVVVLQEVTHLRQAEEWKAEAIQAATHDLRNPLNLMNGALNFLRDTFKEPTREQQECLTMLRSGLDRMSGLVEQVLNLEQVGRTDLHLAGIDLRGIARQVVEEFRLAAEDKAIQLSFDGTEPAGRVLGDENWLNRAVANLVGNAIKYTPGGGRVQVRYREAEGEAVCEVADTGPGIPAAVQARVFERFYRAPGEATRRNPGAGLGLAIVKAIVERHSGRVWVSSAEGRGSTFGLAVPLADVRAAPSTD